MRSKSEADQLLSHVAIGVWENEGGALGQGVNREAVPANEGDARPVSPSAKRPPRRQRAGGAGSSSGRALLISGALLLIGQINGAEALPRGPDAQGWSGSGWYVTSGAYPGARTEDRPTAPSYTLFAGPYALQGDCLAIHIRLYSPIGVCRFLELKPAAFSG
jgi:hypothetical protein